MVIHASGTPALASLGPFLPVLPFSQTFPNSTSKLTISAPAKIGRLPDNRFSNLLPTGQNAVVGVRATYGSGTAVCPTRVF